MLSTSDRYRFDCFTLDLIQGCLLRNDEAVELRPKSFEVLRHLIENSGRLIPKDELLEAVWPNIFVSDGSLKQCVCEIRDALGDNGRIIRTVPRRGYLFAAPVSGFATGATQFVPPVGDVAEHQVIPNKFWFWPSSGLARLGIAAATAFLLLLAAFTLRSGFWTQPVQVGIPDRPSVAVLPFANVNGDPQYDFFSDGISEDLTMELSKFADLFVIARASAFTYKGRELKPSQIGQELGVRYLLYGSVRRYDDQMRLTAQLVESQTGKQLWAESYERPLSYIFAIQNEITEKIVGSLVAHITRSEIQNALRKQPQNLTAYELYLQGNAAFRNVTQRNRGQVIVDSRALYEQAIAADPNYAAPVQGLANNYVFSYLEPTRHEALKGEYRQQATLDRALALARLAVQLDPGLPEAYAYASGEHHG